MKGNAFVSAFAQAGSISSVGDPVEDFANVCYSWYLPEVAPYSIARLPALLSFVQAWLPK